jgi:xylulokinase
VDARALTAAPPRDSLRADVFGARVALTTSTEGPAFGAAILAAVGAGAFASVEEACDALVHVTQVVAPDPAESARYPLYGELRGRFRALAALD